MQVTNLGPLGVEASRYDGEELCFSLSANSKCPTLATFCMGAAQTGTCQAALFNNANNCW